MFHLDKDKKTTRSPQDQVLCLEVSDLQSKASVQGGIIPVILGEKKRQFTNMHEIISLTVLCSLGDVTELVKVFINTQKQCNRLTVQIININSSMQNKN